MTEEPQMNSQQGARNVPILHNIQTNSGVHPASYAVGTQDYCLRVPWLGHKADTHLHLVPNL